MRSIAWLLASASAAFSCAADFPQPEIVDVKTTVAFTPTPKEDIRVIGHSALDRIQFTKSEGASPAYWLVWGRVISNNSGFPTDDVGIYINSAFHPPRLAAITNADGEFKFRLYIREGDRRSNVEVTPDLQGDLLLSQGWWGDVPNPLLGGRAYRYGLADLKAYADKQPQP